MNKEYLLVNVKQYYFDGHGSPDLGRVSKFVTSNLDFLSLNNSLYYRENFDPEDKFERYLDDCICDKDNLYTQDGYNCIAYKYDVESINEVQYESYSQIIKQYNTI